MLVKGIGQGQHELVFHLAYVLRQATMQNHKDFCSVVWFLDIILKIYIFFIVIIIFFFFSRPGCAHCVKETAIKVARSSNRNIAVRHTSSNSRSRHKHLVPFYISSNYRVNPSMLQTFRQFHALRHQPRFNFLQNGQIILNRNKRNASSVTKAATMLRRFLKARYLILTGGLGGGYVGYKVRIIILNSVIIHPAI